MGRLEGKVALITGAGSGFGRATAILFVKEGAKVVVVDYVAEGGEETVRMIKEAGGEAIFVNADVSKTEDVKRMIKATVDNYGELDILYNNAGVRGHGGGVTEITEEHWNKSINIKLTGTWLGMKYAIPEMLKRGGGSNYKHLIYSWLNFASRRISRLWCCHGGCNYVNQNSRC